MRVSRIRSIIMRRYSLTASESESFGSVSGSAEPSSRITRSKSPTRHLPPGSIRTRDRERGKSKES